MPARILVVEHDALIQELIQTTLQGRGYDVNATSDGFTAVQLFMKGDYDLALIEYQLPEMDGYATARTIRSLTEAKGSKLYALTASIAALQQRTGVHEVFDGIIAKPFDVHGLVRLIEKALFIPQHSHLTKAALRLWRDVGLERQPIAKVLPEPSRAQALILSPWFEVSNNSTADMVLLTNSSATSWLSEARLQSDLCMLPVVALKGIEIEFADVTFDVHVKDTWANVAATIKRFDQKRMQLSNTARDPQTLDARLLTSLFLSERPLEPVLDPSRPVCVRHRGFSPESDTIAAAERLAHQGFLSRTFVDRFHCCSACNSNRLNVREECPRCRSANLEEAELIHHFHCAYQAPDVHFRSGTHLVCPKCSQHLRHYGGDYDKPGSVLVCKNCYALNSDPAVGFSCLDCGSHVDGDAAERRELFSYSLTPRAQAFLTRPSPVTAPETVLGLDIIPNSVAETIAKMLSESSETLAGLAIIEVQYRAKSSILDIEGDAAFATLRRLFIENMTNFLAEYACIVTHDSADYVIVSAADDVTRGAFVQDLFHHCQANLSRTLDPSYRIIDATDVRAAA